MVETDIIETRNGAAMGIMINMPHTKLVIIRGEKGYLACGYISPETVERLKDAAVIIKGVNSFDKMLNGKIYYVSKAARKLGIKKSMTPKQALELMI
ncbi:MAG: DUF1805 domain-containing protein [archaeon]